MVRRNPQLKIEVIFVDAGLIGCGQENMVGRTGRPSFVRPWSYDSSARWPDTATSKVPQSNVKFITM